MPNWTRADVGPRLDRIEARLAALEPSPVPITPYTSIPSRELADLRQSYSDVARRLKDVELQRDKLAAALARIIDVSHEAMP